MMANNETGVIQPLQEIISLTKQYGAYTHSDMVQAIGKIDINLKALDLDFITISSHKFGGPIGIGALIYKEKIHLKPLIIGGGQEKGLRSGTENIFAIAGFAKACKYINKMIEGHKRTEILRDEMETNILNICSDAMIIGQQALRLPNTSLIIMPNVKSQTQLINFDLDSIAVSSGSACSSGKVGVSHVLNAMNIDNDLASCAIRVSMAYDQNKDEAESFIKSWERIHLRLGKQATKIAV
jgi:cysteine desulfurase